jgi:hypothetical protein
MREVFDDLRRQIDAAEADWKGVVAADLAALEEKARGLGLSGIIVPRAAAP